MDLMSTNLKPDFPQQFIVARVTVQGMKMSIKSYPIAAA